jgi:four helix bundle protein
MINYDLEERTLRFSKTTIEICNHLSADKRVRPITEQLYRSATSIGANYREANASSSKNDFKNKIHICKKEARETKYWLELLLGATDKYHGEIKSLIDENQQFILIFGKITATLSGNNK